MDQVVKDSQFVISCRTPVRIPRSEVSLVADLFLELRRKFVTGFKELAWPIRGLSISVKWIWCLLNS